MNKEQFFSAYQAWVKEEKQLPILHFELENAYQQYIQEEEYFSFLLEYVPHTGDCV